MKNSIKVSALFIAVVLSLGFYPIDGYEETGITRLIDIMDKFDNGDDITRIPAGALHCTDSIQLNLTSIKSKNMEKFI